MREAGGSGGHNGLKSIIVELGGDDFARLRVGIGRGAGEATSQVLSRFTPDEQRELPELVAAAASCALDWAALGAITAMNRCNRRAQSGPLDQDSIPSLDRGIDTAARSRNMRARLRLQC